MLEIVLAALIQAPAPVEQTVTLPVSLDRVREGLARQGIFDPPKPRVWRGLVFKATVEERYFVLDSSAWAETWLVPSYVQPSSPPAHFQILQSVTPQQIGGASAGVGVDVLPALGAAKRYIGKRLYAAKERRAKKEVAEAMRAAGIRK